MAFMFRLEHEDRTPADPPTLASAVPDWRRGDAIPWMAGHFAWLTFETRTQTRPGVGRPRRGLKGH
jgi:hypothetical protein